MFIYNVTTKVSWAIHEVWIYWMQNKYMPAVLNTNCFVRYQLLKLHEQDETEGPTYIAQYFTESKPLYRRYIELHASNFAKEINDKWGDAVFSFRTLLEIIE